ncbi:hypothetical protein ACQKPX_20655 [Photobacterium sp. DNB23_23_1]|uniref:Uncharacterized protein n=1 Tax=Photobacterium pectinilyticum TaxID=2906793 RepID=A0ABT1N1B9_9GAMM|nr:hypothetical protein [Photobacterium sp. ZSDE20]MCQ1057912.1 hypothetical protein [Photobacterium sp. ZSDE20]MDD1822444.1 hypothetical protein [Photobacterium sp. ZSDE20]
MIAEIKLQPSRRCWYIASSLDWRKVSLVDRELAPERKAPMTAWAGRSKEYRMSGKELGRPQDVVRIVRKDTYGKENTT